MDSTPPPPQTNWLATLALASTTRISGDALETAILATLSRHGRSLSSLQIMTLGHLDYRSNRCDQNSALASLVAARKLIVESVPKPGSMWDRIEVYSIAADPPPSGGNDE